MRVQVYWNFHKRCFSVVGPSGRVIMHTLSLALENPEFRVSKAGNARVRREGVKNVHARIRGVLCAPPKQMSGRIITYNPYRHTSFVYTDNEQPVLKCAFAALSVVDGRPRVVVR